MAFAGVQIRSTRDAAASIDGYRQDLAVGEVIGLSLSSTVGVSTYRWQLIGRPEGSTAGGVGPEPIELGSASSATFTVDADAATPFGGTYIVQCIVNAGAPTATKIKAALCRLSGLTLADGRVLRLPGGFETSGLDTADANVAQGYAKQMSRWLEYIAENAGGGGGGGGSTLSASYDEGSSSADQTLTLTDAAGGTFTVDPGDAGFTGESALHVAGSDFDTYIGADGRVSIGRDGSAPSGPDFDRAITIRTFSVFSALLPAIRLERTEETEGIITSTCDIEASLGGLDIDVTVGGQSSSYLHTPSGLQFTGPSNPGTGIRLQNAPTSGDHTEDSPPIRLRANSEVSSVGHTIDWQQQVRVLATDGTSEYILQQANNSSFITRFRVDDTGLGTIRSISLDGTGTDSYLEFLEGSTSAVSPAGTCRLRWNEGTNKLQISENGGAYVNVV